MPVDESKQLIGAVSQHSELSRAQWLWGWSSFRKSFTEAIGAISFRSLIRGGSVLQRVQPALEGEPGKRDNVGKVGWGQAIKNMKDAGPRGLDFISWVVEGEFASVGEGRC